ncbi:MAG: hypothetical protein E7575_03230 [Ruminococcaceae bacterium]|nr:hypothetical protein [Oscillospiraceae bacterium]
MKLFDLHCDTPLKLYNEKSSLSDSPFHISLSKACSFEKYVQVAAVWSEDHLSDDQCFDTFLAASDYFANEAEGLTAAFRDELLHSDKNAFILAVEDSRLISRDPCGGLLRLYDRGVRVLTLVWGGISAIGGAWDTDQPLSPLGMQVLDACFSLGIIPDISHANEKVAAYTVKRAKEKGFPIIASHSNAQAVYPHKRNLPDTFARALADIGSVIGISLCPAHISSSGAKIPDIISHIKHYINICGSEAVALGCDFDGISRTPEGINNISDLRYLYDALTKEVGFSLTHRVFYQNAYNFFINNLPTQKERS